MIDEYKHIFSVSELCKLLEIERSTYYYQSRKSDIGEKYSHLKPDIEKIISEHASYGYRRIGTELSRQGRRINHKPLRNLLNNSGMKLFRKVKNKKVHPIREILRKAGSRINKIKHLTQISPLRVIYTDFTHIACKAGTFWLICYLDHSSKRVVGWELSKKSDTWVVLSTLRQARKYIAGMGISLNQVIVHQDQGSDFTSYLYLKALFKYGMTPSYAEEGAKDNPFMESFNGRFKDEYGAYLAEAETFEELYARIESSIQDWNQNRIHSALNGRTPNEFIQDVLFKK